MLLIHRHGQQHFYKGQQSVWKTCLRSICFLDEESEISKLSSQASSQDQVFKDTEALTFLIQVLCGLYSPVIGENEVFGQFKIFVREQQELGNDYFSPHQDWLQFVFKEVKKIRSEHLSKSTSQSYGSIIRRMVSPYAEVSLIGSGQLASSILPWLIGKKAVQIISRSPEKAEAILKKQMSQVLVESLSDVKSLCEAVVVAAPVSDEKILEIAQRSRKPIKEVFDLRAESKDLDRVLNEDAKLDILVHPFEHLVKKLDKDKKDLEKKSKNLKVIIKQRCEAFSNRTQFRPYGWDDVWS